MSGEKDIERPSDNIGILSTYDLLWENTEQNITNTSFHHIEEMQNSLLKIVESTTKMFPNRTLCTMVQPFIMEKILYDEDTIDYIISCYNLAYSMNIKKVYKPHKQNPYFYMKMTKNSDTRITKEKHIKSLKKNELERFIGFLSIFLQYTEHSLEQSGYEK
ncbi:hypothetical protein M1145_03175 [Patescibacteria group bacterium]|nr:hypothetical protein [Patescibacteria group bacterium]